MKWGSATDTRLMTLARLSEARRYIFEISWTKQNSRRETRSVWQVIRRLVLTFHLTGCYVDGAV